MSMRLAMKRSLSGQGDSTDGGAEDVAAVPMAKKKKTTPKPAKAKTPAKPRSKPKAARNKKAASNNAGDKGNSTSATAMTTLLKSHKGGEYEEGEAGGTSEGEGREGGPGGRGESEGSGEEDSDDDEPPAAMAASKAARGKARTTAAVEEDEEADSESNDEAEDYDDGYGSDLMGDGDEREDILALPEVERERIVFERVEKRQMREDQIALRKRVQENKRASGIGTKDDGGAEDGAGVGASAVAARKNAQAARAAAAAARAAALQSDSSGESDDSEDGAVVAQGGHGRVDDAEDEEEEEEEEEDSDEPPRAAVVSRPAGATSAAAREDSEDEEDEAGGEGGAEDGEEEDEDDDAAPVRGSGVRAKARKAVREESDVTESSDDEEDGDDDGARRGRGEGGKSKAVASSIPGRRRDSDDEDDYEDENGNDGSTREKQEAGRSGKNGTSSQRHRRGRGRSRSVSGESDDDYEYESRSSSRRPRDAHAGSGSGSGNRDRYRRSSRSRSRSPGGRRGDRDRSRSRERDRRRGGRRGSSRSRSRSRSPAGRSRGGRSGGGEKEGQAREQERAPEPEPEPEPSLEDINRCRVPRDYLERWSNEPYFDKAVLGCFVRVMRGVGRGGERVYAMAEIKGVVPYKRRYKIGNSYTTKCLRISSSTAQERDQCMDIVSNSRLSEVEYAFWKQGRKGAGAPTLTVSECTTRRLRMSKIVQGHKYSSEEVSVMVKKRQQDGVAYKNTALSRIKLTNSLEAAVAEGREEEADFCREQLAKLAEKEAHSKRISDSGAAGMRALNVRNQKHNVHTDTHVGRLKRLEEAKRREASAAGDEGDFDPFKRRSCRPKILWSVGNSPTRPPAGAAAAVPGAGGAAGDGGVEETKSESATNGAVGVGAGAAEVRDAAASVAVAASAPAGLHKMHSFGGVDVLEAGKAALEKRMGEVKTRAAPRAGGKLTLGKYLEKARVP